MGNAPNGWLPPPYQAPIAGVLNIANEAFPNQVYPNQSKCSKNTAGVRQYTFFHLNTPITFSSGLIITNASGGFVRWKYNVNTAATITSRVYVAFVTSDWAPAALTWNTSLGLGILGEISGGALAAECLGGVWVNGVLYRTGFPAYLGGFNSAGLLQNIGATCYGFRIRADVVTDVPANINTLDIDGMVCGLNATWALGY